MNTIFCTLFNANYLDKGLVLYDSLRETCIDFKLYVLAMDNKCFDILEDLNLNGLIPLRLSEVETEELLKIKSGRPFGEYCWTCTAPLVEYILKHLNEPICTFIDADMFFYQDPQVLIDEMLYANASVQVVEHHFHKKNDVSSRVGKYCVEFNTFKNDESGLAILENWKNDCFDCCSDIGDGIHWGDQKYLDQWPARYGDKVNILSNLGGGVARWNLPNYKFIHTIGRDMILKDISTNKFFTLVFYHFDNIVYKDRHNITAPCYLDNSNTEFVDSLYASYLIRIEYKKRFLENNYGLNVIIKSHPALKETNKSIGFYSKKVFSYIVNPVRIYKKIKISRKSKVLI